MLSKGHVQLCFKMPVKERTLQQGHVRASCMKCLLWLHYYQSGFPGGNLLRPKVFFWAAAYKVVKWWSCGVIYKALTGVCFTSFCFIAMNLQIPLPFVHVLLACEQGSLLLAGAWVNACKWLWPFPALLQLCQALAMLRRWNDLVASNVCCKLLGSRVHSYWQ